MSEIFRPHPHQVAGAKFLLGHAAALLLWDPGVGKSATTLMALDTLKRKGMLSRALVLAPLRVMTSVWAQEVEKWEQFAGLRVNLLHGKDKEDELEAESDICVMNYEGLPWLLGDMKRFRRAGFDVLVMDEISKLKHTRTQRFKTLRPVLPLFGRRWGLTGSPAANGLMDLFGVCYAVDLGRSLGQYITHYRHTYFTPSGFMGYEWKLKEQLDEKGRNIAEQQIYERIRPLASRISAEDHLDLPKLVHNYIKVELPPAAMRTYNQMEEALLAMIDEGVVTAANAAAASTKLRQIVNGGIYHDPVPGSAEKREVAELHTAKSEALKDLVDELGGSPLLVAYEFVHDLDRIRAVLGASVPHIGGGVSAKKGAATIEAWNRGELPVLLAHPATLAHGVNLQKCGHHVCWYSLTWNREFYDQFIARVWRQGNKAKRVFIHHILAKDTIDESIVGVLQSKKKTQDALLDALNARRR